VTELRPAIFLDRDGVINKLIHGGKSGHKESYIHSKEQIEWCDGVDEAFRIFFFDTDYDLFIVSNQSGIARFAGDDALFDYRNIEALFRWMSLEIQRFTTRDEFIKRDVIKDMIFCPHLPDAGCACRKPKPGMIYYLAVRYRIDLSKSWMIGDSVTDMKAGWNAGIRRLLKIDEDIPTLPFVPCKPNGLNVKSILEAVNYIKMFDEGRI
jgi:D-glycero-D-manno-heptose 1,7-bisphosphate phosphatase